MGNSRFVTQEKKELGVKFSCTSLLSPPEAEAGASVSVQGQTQLHSKFGGNVDHTKVCQRTRVERREARSPDPQLSLQCWQTHQDILDMKHPKNCCAKDCAKHRLVSGVSSIIMALCRRFVLEAKDTEGTQSQGTHSQSVKIQYLCS